MKHRFASMLLLAAALFTGLWLSAQTASLAGKGNSDYSGGEWIKLNNDFSKLPSGAVNLGGIDFDLARGAKSCLLLGGEASGWKSQASVTFSPALKGKALYLLHTFMQSGSDENAQIVIHYANGSTSKEKLVSGKAVCSWKGSARKVSNALPVWGEYTVSDYAEVQISKFLLTGEVKSIDFIATNKNAKWAVFGVSAGRDRNVAALSKSLELKRVPKAATRFTEEEIKNFPSSEGTPRNIILIIGDGMGLGALNYTSSVVYGKQGQLLMEQLPVKGLCETYSASHDVTDSAASGTALSSGYKTTNGYVAVTQDHKPIRTIAEEARDAGKSVGLLTNDKLTGATPAAFGAHAGWRDEKENIYNCYYKCGFDFLFSTDVEKDKPATEKFAQKGYTVVYSLEDFKNAKPGSKVAGMLPNHSNAALAASATEMLNRLNANPKGFFTMIECAWPDGGGHGNNPDTTVAGVTCVDYVVRAAVEFASKNRDTLVVVTADHETGGIVCTQSIAGRNAPFIHYMASSHTGAPVGVFAVGPGAKAFGTVLNNIDIPHIFAKYWNLPLGRPLVK